MKWQDCYAEYDGSALSIGNSRMEKTISLSGSLVAAVKITDKTSGRIWAGDTLLWQRCPVLGRQEHPACRFSATPREAPGMAPHLKAVLELAGQAGAAWYEFLVFPGIPFVFSQIFAQKAGSFSVGLEQAAAAPSCTGIEAEGQGIGGNDFFCGADTLDCIPLSPCHLEVESVLLRDKTDRNDVLLERQSAPVSPGRRLEREGSVFLVSDYPKGDSLLLVKHSPTPSSALHRQGPDLTLEGGKYVSLAGCGIDFSAMPEGRVPYYASALGACRTADAWEEFWRYSAALSQGDPRRSLFIMSNTWGDRSQDSAVCEEFLLQELDRARELHLDIVQIDDGWQKGVTANSKSRPGVWEGYYQADEGFWQVNPGRFPHGLEPVAARAKEYGIELGLWFSPDSSREFAQAGRDIETLWGLYQRYGVRYFKLDGVKIRSKLCEMRFIHILEELTLRSGGDIRFNLDVTAEDRFGYLYQPQYGSLFVENRYTDFANYYPHNTFRNLWSLASVLPARRLQMEFLNNHRNPENYAGLPFAPGEYLIDYLFAAVMPANPLAWMELSRLDRGSAALLEKITGLYRKYAGELFASRVIPIGSCPDGMSFSGYFCRNQDGRTGHLLLFRESTAEKQGAFPLPVSLEGVSVSFVYQSAAFQGQDAAFSCQGREIRAEFPEPRSFIWLKVR